MSNIGYRGSLLLLKQNVFVVYLLFFVVFRCAFCGVFAGGGGGGGGGVVCGILFCFVTCLKRVTGASSVTK